MYTSLCKELWIERKEATERFHYIHVAGEFSLLSFSLIRYSNQELSTVSGPIPSPSAGVLPVGGGGGEAPR
jgi:hypothetical protein